MINYNTQVRLEAAVSDFIKAKRMFTCGEIVSAVREQYPNLAERYGPMRDHIHSLYYNGRMGSDFAKTPVAFVSTVNGLVSAYVYHPKNTDPRKYTSHELRRLDSSEEVVGLMETGETPEVEDSLNAVPLRSPSVSLTGFPGIMYSIDESGQIVIGKSFTSQLVKTRLASLYALSERRRVTIVSAADSFSGNVTILTLDDEWNARVSQQIVRKSGLENKLLDVVVEDEAIYITAK